VFTTSPPPPTPLTAAVLPPGVGPHTHGHSRLARSSGHGLPLRRREARLTAARCTQPGAGQPLAAAGVGMPAAPHR
jgi:hypothetical protein